MNTNTFPAPPAVPTSRPVQMPAFICARTADLSVSRYRVSFRFHDGSTTSIAHSRYADESLLYLQILQNLTGGELYNRLTFDFDLDESEARRIVDELLDCAAALTFSTEATR